MTADPNHHTGPRPVIVVTARRRSHELFLLAVSVLTGASFLLTAPPPGSVAAVLPAAVVYAWAGGLVLSGVAGLCGCLWRGNVERALLMEQGAMLVGAAAMLIYSVAVFSAAGWRGLFGGGITVGWMAANLVTAIQIRGDLHNIRRPV